MMCELVKRSNGQTLEHSGYTRNQSIKVFNVYGLLSIIFQSFSQNVLSSSISLFLLPVVLCSGILTIKT